MNSFPDYQVNHAKYSPSSNLYAAAGSVGYISPEYESPSSKTQVKRGRGRPRGSRNTSPRGSAPSTIKSATGRGGPRGRRRSNRAVRGQHGIGRGKRKRPEWEESESEEEVLSSEPEELEHFEPSQATNAEPMEQEVEEEEEGEVEGEEEEGEGETEEGQEEEEENSEDPFEQKDFEEPKPPIKLRIIRRNDTNAFVSKVGIETIENIEKVEENQIQTDHSNTIVVPVSDSIPVPLQLVPPQLPDSQEHNEDDPTEIESPGSEDVPDEVCL